MAKDRGSEILLFATPTWLGRPSSIAQRVLERMDAMIAETDEDERPVARALESKPIPAPPSE